MYVLLTAVGVLFGGLVTLQTVVGRGSQPLGLTIILVGLVTLAWWYERVRGAGPPSRSLRIAGRSLLIAGTAVGYALLSPEVGGALGLP